jgi:uncharacterized protein YidB (DUF937 family)
MGENFSGRSGGLAGGLSSGMKMAAVALLVHQLMKHARAGQEAAPQQGGAAGGSTGGGFGDLLGGLLGGGGGAAGGTATGGAGGGLLGGVLAGLGGLLGSLRGHGLTQQVDSWVSPGPNQPISPTELERAIDPAAIDDAARQAGTDRSTLLQEISRMLPDMVDRMTPGGQVPEREEELGTGGIGDVLRRLAGDEARPETRRY